MTVYCHNPNILPHSIRTRTVSDRKDVVRMAANDDNNLFIWRPTKNSSEINNRIDDFNMKAIAWAHNSVVDILRSLSEKENLYCFVFVSKEQRDNLRMIAPFDKSTYIHNGFDGRRYFPESISSDGETVTFLGGIYPQKGFHRLAEVWPEIINKYPEAELKVIGSGKLYDREQELGKWGIASESYEQSFRPYLSKSDGSPLDSVSFYGMISEEEKIDIIQDSTVGVVNPVGTETFCISAVEFQAAGTPVVTKASGGVLDTVKHEETGLLHQDKEGMVNNIYKLLTDENVQRKYASQGIQFISYQFTYSRICANWLRLFVHAENDQPIPTNQCSRDYNTIFDHPSDIVLNSAKDFVRKSGAVKLRDLGKKSKMVRKMYNKFQ